MMKSVSKVAGTIAAVVMISSAASAALLDFTDENSYTTRETAQATGSINGINWTVTSAPAEALTYTVFDGLQGDIGPLKGDFDGIGVTDDEITYDEETGLSEAITVTFDRKVYANAFYFLDLFTAQDGASNEIAEVFADGELIATFDASDAAVVGNDSGYRFGTLGSRKAAQQFSFTALADNDNVGFADYALAGMDVAPIPLPAGALLLGTGLIGLGGAAAKRRRKV